MNEVTTMSDIMEALKLSAMTTQRVSEQMGLINTKVARLEEDVATIKDRQQYYEDSLRITRSQGKMIKQAVISRVNQVLGIEFEGGKVADDCIEIDQKYRGGFISRCYTDTKRAGVMAECYWETSRADYDKCLEYIEAWVPQVDGGVAEYKRYLDIRREERKAKE